MTKEQFEQLPLEEKLEYLRKNLGEEKEPDTVEQLREMFGINTNH